jgi:hypothetical protein
MPIHRAADPTAVAAALEHVQIIRGEALFAFFGSQDPGTGESWCKDCVTADPVLRGTVTTVKPTVPLFECPVGERAQWKDIGDHPYRIHPVWRLERIPTLVHVVDGVERGRLVEGACSDPVAVERFLRG